MAALIATSWLHTGCAIEEEPHIASSAEDSTVGDYQYSGCSTAVVIGLSKQIAEEANCEHPGNFVPFTATNGIMFTSSAVLPFLAKSARDDLQTVAAQSSLQINSALRTVVQQYLLYEWYLQGRCGITAAATPGTSNHEGGRAVDLANWDTRVTAMANHGWAHDVPGDVVHFDHTSSPDNRGEDVIAFQKLWNLNNPNDKISVDGSYGPQTAARVQMSPATGFAIGASCVTQTQYDADVVSVDGPDRVPPQTQAHYAVTLKNTGTVDWPAATKVRLASGTSSQLHDDSWVSETVVTTLGTAVTAGSKVTVEFDVTTPAETDDTPLDQKLELDDAGNAFGSFDLALTVSPGTTAPTSSDGNDEPGAAVSGGCNAGGGGGGGLAWLAVAVIGLVRRRRAA